MAFEEYEIGSNYGAISRIRGEAANGSSTNYHSINQDYHSKPIIFWANLIVALVSCLSSSSGDICINIRILPSFFSKGLRNLVRLQSLKLICLWLFLIWVRTVCKKPRDLFMDFPYSATTPTAFVFWIFSLPARSIIVKTPSFLTRVKTLSVDTLSRTNRWERLEFILHLVAYVFLTDRASFKMMRTVERSSTFVT